MEEDATFCPKCGTRQVKGTPEPTRNAKVKSKGNSTLAKPWMVILLAILLCVLLFFLFNPFNSKKADLEEEQEEQVEKEKTDSLNENALAMEQQLKEDSLMKVAKAKEDSLEVLKDSLKNIQKQEKNQEKTEQKEKKSQTVAAQPRTVSNASAVRTGTLNLAYGSYKGSVRNGKPHGVNGRLVFKTPHQIDSRDPKGRVAEPGDYVIGEFYEGHLVQGIWYDANNQVKGSLIIGR